MTNLEKYIDVFGYTPDITECMSPNEFDCEDNEYCEQCEWHHWWEKAYKGGTK